jgi:hypothetical protein
LSRKKEKKVFIVEHENGYVPIHPKGKKPPIKESPLKPIDYYAGATLENGILVNLFENSRKEVKKKLGCLDFYTDCRKCEILRIAWKSITI